MKYSQISGLSDGQFLRLSGVKRGVFCRMVDILKELDIQKRSRDGRPHSLTIEDRLLLTLEYFREYRTYFHIGQSYGISESAAYQTVKWVEEALIKHPDFALPEKKLFNTMTCSMKWS